MELQLFFQYIIIYFKI